MKLKVFSQYNFSEYQNSERKHSDIHTRRCIDGSITGCNKVVGYCSCNMHEGYLTEKLRKQHQCIEKNCFHHISKENTPNSKLIVPVFADICEKVQHAAEEETVQYDGIKILSTRQAANNQFVINYVTISNCYPITQVAEKLSALFRCTVNMNKINCDYDRAVELIFS